MNDASMNLMEISIGKMLNLIKEQIEDEMFTVPMLFLGKSGIGKTESVMDVAKKMGIGFKEFRLITTNEVDLMGTPDIEVDEDGKRWSTFNPSRLLPDAKRDGECGILVLDEITSATANVRTAAMQLMDKSRSIGLYKLPPKWLVVCLGNGEEDGGNFNGMEFAFLNRCIAYRVKTEVDCADPVRGLGWVQWATQHSINPAVVSFIKQYGMDVLHKFDTDLPASAFPSPRGWTTLARKLTIQENKNGGKPLDSDSVAIISSGPIGKEMAQRFAAHYRFKDQLLDPKDILSGKVDYTKFAESKDRSIVLMQLTSVANFLIDSLRDDLDGPITAAKLDSDGHLKVSDENLKCLNGFIELMVTLKQPEDALYLFSTVKCAYEGKMDSTLSRVPNYEKFKNSNAFKYLSTMSTMVK